MKLPFKNFHQRESAVPKLPKVPSPNFKCAVPKLQKCRSQTSNVPFALQKCRPQTSKVPFANFKSAVPKLRTLKKFAKKKPTGRLPPTYPAATTGKSSQRRIRRRQPAGRPGSRQQRRYVRLKRTNLRVIGLSLNRSQKRSALLSTTPRLRTRSSTNDFAPQRRM